MELLIIAGVDITHVRLIDLTRLADQVRPFYEWIEQQFQMSTSRSLSLNELLMESSADEIHRAIEYCYEAKGTDLPFLFDGAGRTYSHSKACYYFFSWLIRDAPQQRLGPLVQRVVRNTGKGRSEVEVDVLTALICKYRSNVKTFAWQAIREVIIDRLEGSRRSIRGHEKEIVVRTALVVAIQNYFERHKSYGIYEGVEIPAGQVVVGNETYDISLNLLDERAQTVRRILVPIKTRETEGGGHSHLFTRDLLSAISAVRSTSLNDFLMVVIVATNWSARETNNLLRIVDHLVVFDTSPSKFIEFNSEAQQELDDFITSVLDGTIAPKAGES
ncbi:MAG: hypothetical protein HRF40_01290 [Nitrososphaera sp.]